MSIVLPTYPDTAPFFVDIKWPELPLVENKSVLHADSTGPTFSDDTDVAAEQNKLHPWVRVDVLGFMGEGILFNQITKLIVKLYPNLTRDLASSIRRQVLSTPILATISKHYAIPAKPKPDLRAKPDGAAEYKFEAEAANGDHISSKEYAEAFEAYIGAFSYELLSHDSSTAPCIPHSKGNDTMVSPAVKEATHDESNSKHDKGSIQSSAAAGPPEGTKSSRKRARQEGDVPPQSDLSAKHPQAEKVAELEPFLDALFRQIVIKTYQKSEAAYKLASSTSTSTTISRKVDPKFQKYIKSASLINVAQGAKAELHLYLTNKKLPIPSYLSERVWPDGVDGWRRRGEQGMVWETWCSLSIPQLDVIEEQGIALNTKDASNIAAYRVLQELRKLE